MTLNGLPLLKQRNHELPGTAGTQRLHFLAHQTGNHGLLHPAWLYHYTSPLLQLHENSGCGVPLLPHVSGLFDVIYRQ